MGNSNCRKCFEKNTNNSDEIIIHNRIFSSENDKESSRNNRTQLLEELKLNNKCIFRTRIIRKKFCN